MISKLKLSIFLLSILLLGSVLFIKVFNKGHIFTNPTPDNQISDNQLRLIKTNPEPLDNATILPTQELEFTFSAPIYRTELKHHFDPDIPHTVEVVNGIDSEHGATVKIKFNKPLDLGSGYTLFIESSTKVNDKLRLDRDYIYHFKTIGYRGV